MKVVLSYTFRSGGSAAENNKAAAASQQLLDKWMPSQAELIKEWVSRVDGNGGFAVLEGDIDLAQLYKDMVTWSPWLEFEVCPVLDIGEATPLAQEGIATAGDVL